MTRDASFLVSQLGLVLLCSLCGWSRATSSFQTRHEKIALDDRYHASVTGPSSLAETKRAAESLRTHPVNATVVTSRENGTNATSWRWRFFQEGIALLDLHDDEGVSKQLSFLQAVFFHSVPPSLKDATWYGGPSDFTQGDYFTSATITCFEPCAAFALQGPFKKENGRYFYGNLVESSNQADEWELQKDKVETRRVNMKKLKPLKVYKKMLGYRCTQDAPCTTTISFPSSKCSAAKRKWHFEGGADCRFWGGFALRSAAVEVPLATITTSSGSGSLATEPASAVALSQMRSLMRREAPSSTARGNASGVVGGFANESASGRAIVNVSGSARLDARGSESGNAGSNAGASASHQAMELTEDQSLSWIATPSANLTWSSAAGGASLVELPPSLSEDTQVYLPTSDGPTLKTITVSTATTVRILMITDKASPSDMSIEHTGGHACVKAAQPLPARPGNWSRFEGPCRARTSGGMVTSCSILYTDTGDFCSPESKCTTTLSFEAPKEFRNLILVQSVRHSGCKAQV